jgi:hypothetical protein
MDIGEWVDKANLETVASLPFQEIVLPKYDVIVVMSGSFSCSFLNSKRV